VHHQFGDRPRSKGRRDNVDFIGFLIEKAPNVRQVRRQPIVEHPLDAHTQYRDEQVEDHVLALDAHKHTQFTLNVPILDGNNAMDVLQPHDRGLDAVRLKDISQLEHPQR